MIPYEELCAALERFAQIRQGGAPRPTAPSAAGDGEDRTHVGAPEAEIDLGDVLSDDER
jgi:hypothetical protein